MPALLLRCISLSCVAFALAACTGSGNGDSAAGSGTTPPSNATPVAATLSPTAVLGQKIFNDASLSAGGKVACATCHDKDHAFAGTSPTDAVPLGGPDVTTPGFRNTPSIKYLAFNPAFFFDADDTPTGGFNRDGRAKSLAEQARRPFFAPHEMANATVADMTEKLSRASYADDFRKVFGEQIFNTPDAALDRALLAIQAFELEDNADFAPFSSKFDAFLENRASLTPQELRGLALFNDPKKGNCGACHLSTRGPNGQPPLFTDFTYDNLGVPRNPNIAANSDPAYFDLGLCGPDRTDLSDQKDLCGAFKVPSLRNVAITPPYFHNGRFLTLTDLVRFYVRRDTNPEEFYPVDPQTGQAHKFDDLPAEYAVNVNTTEAPYNRRPGDMPALSEAEIQDVVAFLQTLTDGYKSEEKP